MAVESSVHAYPAGSRLPSRWRLDRWILAAGIGLIIGAIVVAAVLIGNLKARVIAGKSRELNNLALVLSQESERAFQALDTLQAGLVERIGAFGAMTPRQFEDAMSTRSIHTMLRDKADALPFVDALTLIDTAGRLRNFSRYWPIPEINVSDRDYFHALMGDPELDSFLSAPVLNRGSGTWTIYLAKKVRAPDRTPLGLALGAMSLDYLEQFYRSLQVGSGGAISMFRDDGVLLLRYPRAGDSMGRAMVPPLKMSDVRNRGAVRHVSPIDNQERLTAAHHLEGYPVRVTVSVTIDSLAADWRPEASAIAGGAAVVCLLTLVSMMFGRRQLRAQYRFAASAGYLARHDTLTGLPNRLLFSEQLHEQSRPRSGPPHPACVLLVDLDYFKTVNDSLGHSAGDRLLCVIGERLRRVLGDDALVARLGGDEFAILLRGERSRTDVGKLAQRVVNAVAEPYDMDGNQIVTGASVGVTFFPEDGGDADQLLQNADMALYRAKAAGRGTWHAFEPQMADQMRKRHALELALRNALSNDGFELHFQPVVDAQSSTLSGFEALLRWKRGIPKGATTLQLIQVAEETGMIIPIGRWVLETACREAVTWPAPVRVAVNVSACEFRSGDVVEQVRHALSESGLAAHRLELEITETVLLQDTPQLRATLEQLRRMGVCIALDDFGTGYSSLSYLRRFPADRIKIDISFVTDICKTAESARIVRSIVDLARSLGMQTTAEGVESREQWEQLRACGCGEIQGYYVGPPAPAERAAAYLQRYGHLGGVSSPKAPVG